MTLPDISASLEAALDRFELFDKDGSRQLAIVIKQRFVWDAHGRTHRAPGALVTPVDVPYPDAGTPMHPSDLFLRKPACDVVVAGTARAERPVTELDVRVEVGPLTKSLRVFGPRVWYRSLGMTRPTDPQPFDQLPLLWEHAYGGMDISDPEKLAEEPRNPLGRGVVSHVESLEGMPLPQIEDPRDLITGARSKPAPAGVSALTTAFAPRRTYAGTMDQRWEDERMPLVPEDFDERFNQVAHPELIGDLKGGEPVRILNVGQPGVSQFKLPRLVFQVDARADRGEVTGYRPVLDTVVILPDEGCVDLTHRTAIPLRRGPAAVREVLIFEKRIV